MNSVEIINSVKSYEFNDSLNLFMIMYSLAGINRKGEAIFLYEKFLTEIKESGNEINGLLTTIVICQENGDFIRLEKYTDQLRIIAPNHNYFSTFNKKNQLIVNI